MDWSLPLGTAEPAELDLQRERGFATDMEVDHPLVCTDWCLGPKKRSTSDREVKRVAGSKGC